MDTVVSESKRRILPYQEFLTAEFNYIAQTAFQANEDRSRSSQFFLITFGTFLAALLSTQFDNIDLEQLYIAFIVVFLVIAIFGALTVMQIVRLRLAWLESVFAMNILKESLIDECPALEKCFRWKTSTIPSPYKASSIGFFMALQVSLVSGIAIGAATAFSNLAIGNKSVPWFLCIITGLLSMSIFLWFFYVVPLRRKQSIH